MSIKGKVVAAAAVMTLVGGVSTVGTLTAQAATPSCFEHCIDLFSHKFGSSFVLDVQQAQGKAGQPIRLFPVSDGNKGEDFFISQSGLVSGFARHHLVSPTVGLHFGGGCSHVSSTTHKCLSHYPDDLAYQIEYAPLGVPSGLCMGLAQPAGDGTKVVLEPCGSSTTTTWVVPPHDALGNHAVPLANGSDTNAADPFVLNYPGSAAPFRQPTPQLTTWSLQRYPNGHVFNNQLWSAGFGALRGGF